MSMTVRKLHQLLGQLVVAGHGRKPVCVDKSSFSHPLEGDGVAILDVAGARGPVFVNLADDDGGTKQNKNGTESGRQTVILFGEAEDPEQKPGASPAPPFVPLPPHVVELAEQVRDIEADLADFDGDRRGIAHALGEAREKLLSAVLAAVPAT